jgi:hypothetical protein
MIGEGGVAVASVFPRTNCSARAGRRIKHYPSTDGLRHLKLAKSSTQENIHYKPTAREMVEPVSTSIGAASLLIQVVGGCMDAFDLWRRANEVGEDVVYVQARLSMQQARVKTWKVEWGFEEGQPLPSTKFKDYVGLAVTYLTLIQRRLTGLQGFDERYPSLFKYSSRMRGTDSANRMGQIGHMGELDEDLAAKLRDEIQQVNHGTAIDRWRWARRDGKGREMVEQVNSLVTDLENFFPPPSRDPKALVVFNQSLSSSDLETLKGLIRNTKNQDPTLASLAELKETAAALEQRSNTTVEPENLPWRMIDTSIFTDLGTVWITRHKDKTPLMIEWKTIPVTQGPENKAKLETRIQNLARLLQAKGKPKELRTLDCAWLVQKPVAETEDLQYGLVFKLPSPVVLPLSLFQLLSNHSYKPASLNQRFNLAQCLARAVLFLHLAGWLHKGLRSANILFFGADNAEMVQLEEPYLSGFEYSRMDKSGALTEDVSDDLEQNLYRHPENQGLPVSPEQTAKNSRKPYNQLADLYSLGVLLLEIGLWRSALSVHAAAEKTSGQGIDALKFKHLALAQLPEVRRNMGDTYCNAIERCLKSDFPADEPQGEMTREGEITGEGKTTLVSFYLHLVRALENCSI